MSISFQACKLVNDKFTYLDNEVNVSNANAKMLARFLGMGDIEPCGEITNLFDFITKCDMALATLDKHPEYDEGRLPSEMAPGARGCKFIDCGLRPGWFRDNITRLRCLAKKALDEGYTMNWA